MRLVGNWIQSAWNLLIKLHIILRSIFKNVISCPNQILTSHIGNFWYFKMQLCFMHCTLDHICMSQKTFEIQIGLEFWKKSTYGFLIFWVFFESMFSNSLSPQKNHCKKVLIFQIKGPFIKWKYLTLSLPNFNGPLIQTNPQIRPISDSIYIFSHPN